MLDLKVYRSSQFSEEIPPEGEFEIVAIQDITDKHHTVLDWLETIIKTKKS